MQIYMLNREFTATAEYRMRVYAGVLGKIIGVYLGRPVENWPARKIKERFGTVKGYVNDELQSPLVVVDDDISGTFCFIRLFEEQHSSTISSADIGNTWLNYLIENRSTLWWGGRGHSTEHTAYLNLKRGVTAPDSGSVAMNGSALAEQIGAQIFVDGWAMLLPCDPAKAAALAKKAAQVSHDGEAVYAAQVIAAIESYAFIEKDINVLLDVGLKYIPDDSVIARMIMFLRELREKQPNWRQAFSQINRQYGYHRWPGICHVVPNHAAVIASLLYGGDRFSRSILKCVNMGWDTDCNCATVGCIMGIKNGLDDIDGPEKKRAPDDDTKTKIPQYGFIDPPEEPSHIAGRPLWRKPIADRLFVSSANGGDAVTDATQIADLIVHLAREDAKIRHYPPKYGFRYHFEDPGSLHGFRPIHDRDGIRYATTRLSNGLRYPPIEGKSKNQWSKKKSRKQREAEGRRSLIITARFPLSKGTTACRTATFITPEHLNDSGSYPLMATPALSSGQLLRLRLYGDSIARVSCKCRILLGYWGPGDIIQYVESDIVDTSRPVSWVIPDTEGMPICYCGLVIRNYERTIGTYYLDRLTWDGAPTIRYRSIPDSVAWRRAWVSAVDHWLPWGASFQIAQNSGRGLLMQGTRKWQEYRVETTVSTTHAAAIGIACAVRHLRGYWAILLRNNGDATLVEVDNGEERELARIPVRLKYSRPYRLALQTTLDTITAEIDDNTVVVKDIQKKLVGGIALIVDNGSLSTDSVEVRSTAPKRMISLYPYRIIDEYGVTELMRPPGGWKRS